MQGMVSLQPYTSEDCIDRIYHRLNEDYHILHQFCRFFLDNTIPDHEKGKNTTLPFLVNMARLYEMFVAEWLKGNLPQNFTLKTQERINIGENIYFQTDLILYDTTDSKPKYILDTKYKNHKNPSSEDIAQVVAYAVSKGCPETVLVYPTELNYSLDKYTDKIRVRNLTFALDDKIEDAGNTFLTKLFS
jgi:5-methylcytosine-specific restriction enzyme subunit McrC